MSRYGNNIRRIAQTDELNARIRQAEQKLNVLDKSAIPGGRGIAYPSGAGQSGSPGQTNPDKNGNPDEKNPSDKDKTDEAGKDGKTTDGGSIIDGTKVLQPGEDPGKIALKDCETNEPIDILLNSASNEGERKFQHPEGWSIDGQSENNAGYDNWTLGQYWTGSSAYFGTGSGSNQDGTADAPAPEVGYQLAIGYVNGSLYTVTDARLVSSTVNSPTSISLSVEYYLTWTTTTSNNGWVLNPQSWDRQPCNAETGTDRCITAIPEAFATWQDQDADYRHQLAFSSQDGGFVSSSNDKDIPAKFRNDVGSGKGLNNLRLCTEDGDEVVMSALIDGTFAYFKEDGFGQPEEDAKIYHFDKDGKYKDIIRADEYSNLRSTNNPGA
jgi:hypothetical protein